jgi:signal transduction histidine kinase
MASGRAVPPRRLRTRSLVCRGSACDDKKVSGSSEEPLWRAIAVFRFLSLGYAMALVGFVTTADYSRLDWAWVALAAMTVWTVATTFGYAHRRGRTVRLLTLDLLVTAGLLLSTLALQYPSELQRGVMPVTAIWVAGPVLAWAVRYGRAAGAVTALILSGCDFALRHGSVVEALNGAVLLLLAGLIVGHLSRLAAELETQRKHMDQIEAAGRERERLARDIHDSVLQVLAMVQRRGLEAGGEAAELGRLAGQQEAALRALVGMGNGTGSGSPGAAGSAPTSGPGSASGLGPAAAPGLADLRTLLLTAQSAQVTVSAPAQAVLVYGEVARQLTAAVTAALDNVRQHCGEQARAWVLIEDEPDAVTVTIRDDGPGIPAGRLAEAAAAGRLGVSHSIRGRLSDLGGSARISSVPGEGTSVELRLPRGDMRVRVPLADSPLSA